MLNSNPNPIRVMILDEQESVRKNLANFLESDEVLELVATASNGGEAFRLCSTFNPDMLLMNLPLPDTNEAHMMQEIGDAHPTVQIVALSNLQDDELVRTALQVGVISCLLNDSAVA